MTTNDSLSFDKCKEALEAAVYYMGRDDPEVSHGDADAAIMVFLREIGHGELADLFDKVEAWYA